MREIRLSGSEGGGPGNSTGSPYPYPQVPDLSVGAGRARDGGGCGRWWLVAEADAGASGAAFPISDQQTISMVRTAHPLGRAWGEGGSGVGSSRDWVAGK